MPYDVGQPGPPNSSPEPPGLAASVSKIFGTAPPAQEAPDPYDLLGSPEAALKLLTETRKFCDPGRENFEWGWWRALMYFMGRQWIYWNPSTRTWNDKRLARWVPKPVTNKIRETYDSIFAVLADIQLGANAEPVGRDPKNVLTAQTADEMIPLLDKEHKMSDRVMAAGDFWAIILGTGFFHPHWDPDAKDNTRAVQLWNCQACQSTLPSDAIVANGQKCPNCQASGMALRPQMQPDGTPATEQRFIGGGRTLAVSPLELLLPLYAQCFDAVDRLIFTTWIPRHEVEGLAPTLAKSGKIQWTTSPQQRSLQMYRSLGMQSDLPLTPQVWNSTATLNEVQGATLQYLWLKPCHQYPLGVYLPFVGEGTAAQPAYEMIEARSGGDQGGGSRPEIPYKNAQGASLWPWIYYPYKPVEGRLYAQSAIDSVIPKQDQLNQIDSMTQLVANRMGNPIWLEPKGSEVERLTGEPGLIVRWQPIGNNAAKPERIDGMNPPQSFFALRQQFLADIEDGTGTYDVVKGAKPTGVEAFSALQLLVERSQSRFTPTFKTRGDAYAEWAYLAIEFERAYGPTTRIANVQGPNRRWTQKEFLKADLRGDIQIVASDGSRVPKTALGRRAAIEHGVQLGIVNPQANPDQNFALLREIGIADLAPSLDNDVSACMKEQQATEDWAAAGFQGPCPLVVMPWHQPMVHLNENRKWMNTDAVADILAMAEKFGGPAFVMQIVQTFADHLTAHQGQMMALNASNGEGHPQADAEAQAEQKTGDHAPGNGQALRSSRTQSKPQRSNQPAV